MPDQPARFLVMRGGALGDFLLTLPVFHALKRRWPNVHIEVAGYPRMTELAIAGGLAEATVSLDRAEMARLFAAGETLSDELSTYFRSFDVVLSYLYDPHAIVRENLAAARVQTFISGSPLVGQGHAAEHLLAPLESLALYEQDPVARLRLREGDLRWGWEWLAARGVTAFFAVHPGSGSPKKNWPLQNYLDLANRLAAERGEAPLFILGEAEGELAGVLAQDAPDVPVLQGASVLEVASVLAHARGYLGNDSGITHLAAALGRPVTALFGPTDPGQWAPRGEHVKVLRAPGGELSALDVDVVWRGLCAEPRIDASERE